MAPGRCARCRATAAAEARALAPLAAACRRAFRGCAIIQTPLVAPPPRGVAALERWARQLDVMKPKGTYVYCVVAASRSPSLAWRAARAAGHRAGPAARRHRRRRNAASRAMARRGRRSARALRRSGHQPPACTISTGSRAPRWRTKAWSNRSSRRRALLPMKLFTIFTSDERALAHIAQQRDHVRTILKRVASHDEWGVRVVLDPSPRHRAREQIGRAGGEAAVRRRIPGGQESACAMRIAGWPRTRAIVIADLNDLLAHHSSLARRRGARDLPVRRRPAAARRGISRRSFPRPTISHDAGPRSPRLEPEGYRVSLDVARGRHTAFSTDAKSGTDNMARKLPARREIIDCRQRARRARGQRPRRVGPCPGQGCDGDGRRHARRRRIDLIYLRLSTLLCAADRLLPTEHRAPKRRRRRSDQRR